MSDKDFKRNLRVFCKKFNIRAHDIVIGTGLSDSIVAEMYNPNSETTISLSHAVQVTHFLRNKTGALVNIQYFLGDDDFERFRQMLEMISDHLRDRQGALKYYEDNLGRMIADEKVISAYLAKMIGMSKTLDS